MSAPTTHDPLVVNTKDGVTWLRRAVMQDGRGLYAVTDSCKCPPYLMATLAELAEHGIVGSADVLPMSVGPQPLALSEAQIDALAAAGNRVVNDAVHEDLCMCDTWPEKCLSSGNFHMGDWDMGGLESALPAVLALWEQMRGGELEQVHNDLTGANLSLWEEERTNERLRLALESAQHGPHGRAELRGSYQFAEGSRQRWRTACIEAEQERDQLKARVTELEAERHSTNEALDDAVQALRARQTPCPCPPADLPGPHQVGCPQDGVREDGTPYVSRPLPPNDAVCARPGCGHRGEEHHHGGTTCWARLPKRHGDPITICECAEFVPGPSVAESADRLSRFFSPAASLREAPSGETDPGRRAAWRMLSREEPHDSPLHRPYATPHDLDMPATGGAQ